MTDDDRQKILARRAKFVAAAVTALSVGACKPQPPEACLSAQPCLSVQPEPEPEPCLSMRPMPEGADAGPEPEPEPEPRVCLSMPNPDAKQPGPYAEPPPGKR
ncbi:MAG: hypothetical protein IT377_14025 [Polyangiaceae bacterium]|nr:hypothetical protein [Polyangiaceae bacterium]